MENSASLRVLGVHWTGVPPAGSEGSAASFQAAEVRASMSVTHVASAFSHSAINHIFATRAAPPHCANGECSFLFSSREHGLTAVEIFGRYQE